MDWVEITREEYLALYETIGIAETRVGHYPSYMELICPDGSGLKCEFKNDEAKYYKRGEQQ